MNFNKITKYKVGVGVIFTTWLLFFSPIISGQYIYFLDDLKIIYFPLETLYAQFQHNWQLPVWANEFGFGQPLLAWGQLGFFTPLHFIMRALFIPPLTLLQISVVSYFLLGNIGMFIFLLRRNFHQAAAVLGAITFAYCGFNIGHLNHVNFYTSTMLLPWLLIAIDAFIRKASIRSASVLALTATAIVVSGQPQVVLYVFSIASILGLSLYIRALQPKIIVGVLYAGVLAFLLSSFALYPLLEFLPETERAGGLPKQELFEFSYPPYASITLILPYFFGDHASYSGPKGFQELAAYVGIIPLMLAGAALTSWKSFRGERIGGIALALIGGVLVLGRYSPVYTYLVEQNYITTIGVVGRFVFFFDIGIVFLATVGLHDLLIKKTSNMAKHFLQLSIALLFPVLLVAVPFGIQMANNKNLADRFYFHLSVTNMFWWAIALGCVCTTLIILAQKSRILHRNILVWSLPVLTAMTLVLYGWNYNPRTITQSTETRFPFLQDLANYKNESGLPARLYAASRLPVEGNPHVEVKLSDFISPTFTVMQPLSLHRSDIQCIKVPVHAESAHPARMTISVQSRTSGQVFAEKEISSEGAKRKNDQEICFSSVPDEEKNNLSLKLTSTETTNMRIFVTASKSDSSNVSFIRVQNPTPEQLEKSIKPLSMQYTPIFSNTTDTESALMVRHIQTIAGAQSARWIGALSIKPYRFFIDTFFANDSEAFDGDGIHALTRNKKLVDMAGITHFIQLLDYGQTNDPMLAKGYELVREVDIGDSLMRLYKNPGAYPKAYIVPNANFVASSDETRFRLRNPQYDPKELVYVSGDAPPTTTPQDSTIELISSANIIKYTNTRVDVEVTSNKDAFLVLTDSTTPEWNTYVDDKPALFLQANMVFKAAQIPAGEHIVSFRYNSPAIQKSKQLTGIGLALLLIGFAYQPISAAISSRVR